MSKDSSKPDKTTDLPSFPLKDVSPEPEMSSSNAPEQYRSVTWGPWWGVFTVILAFLVSQVAADIVVTAIASAAHLSNDWLSSTTGQFIFVAIAEGLAVVLTWLLLRRAKATLKGVGFGRKPKGKDVLYALAVGVVYFVILYVAIAIASVALQLNVDQKQELGFDSVVGHTQLILTFISLVVLPPIVEETLFRGVLFGGFRKRMKYVWAALITSLLFAAPHLLEGGSSLLWVGGIDTFILSMALCYLREKTGSLWAGVLLHMIKNGTAYLFLYVFVSH